MQEILYIIVLSFSSVVVLFILTKIMGYRQMSQLSMFDYINGISIGSIAAEMATAIDGGFEKPLIAMIVYAVVSTLLSYVSMKSIKARRIITGKPLILMDKGIIFEKNLFKAKIDINELLTQCRISGYFDISKIQTAILEDNGKISFLPIETERPATPADLNMNPTQEVISANVIIDGKLLMENLNHCGKDEKWLQSQLKAYGAASYKDVVLATYVPDNKLNIYTRTQHQMNKNILM